jgi:hypothetical protein
VTLTVNGVVVICVPVGKPDTTPPLVVVALTHVPGVVVSTVESTEKNASYCHVELLQVTLVKDTVGSPGAAEAVSAEMKKTVETLKMATGMAMRAPRRFSRRCLPMSLPRQTSGGFNHTRTAMTTPLDRYARMLLRIDKGFRRRSPDHRSL